MIGSGEEGGDEQKGLRRDKANSLDKDTLASKWLMRMIDTTDALVREGANAALETKQ